MFFILHSTQTKMSMPFIYLMYLDAACNLKERQCLGNRFYYRNIVDYLLFIRLLTPRYRLRLFPFSLVFLSYLLFQLRKYHILNNLLVPQRYHRDRLTAPIYDKTDVLNQK